MTRKICAFNELSVGTVFKFGTVPCIKLRDAIPNVGLSKQGPNALKLDTGHYVVIGATAKCLIVKTLDDPKYLLNDNDSDVYDWDC